MSDDLRAGLEEKIAAWERTGLTFKRESPATAATIRNIMADFRTLLVSDGGPELPERAKAAECDAARAVLNRVMAVPATPGDLTWLNLSRRQQAVYRAGWEAAGRECRRAARSEPNEVETDG